ncbi:MAG: hypothetical protein CMO20_00885 [Thermoplasmata archaeon]|nr:hypothetical protein [Thermoplasmata archaeon]
MRNCGKTLKDGFNVRIRAFKSSPCGAHIAPAATPHGPWPSPAGDELWYQVRGIAAFEGRSDPFGDDLRCKKRQGEKVLIRLLCAE